MELGLKDKKIIYSLDLNSRQSISKIASKVRLSKEVVNYRIKRLEKEGIIKGYYPIIDFSLLGYISARMYLKFMDLSPKLESEIYSFLNNNDNVLFILRIESPFDLVFSFLAKDIYGFEEFYNLFKKRFKPYIAQERFSIHTKIHHFHRAYILDREKDTENPQTIGLGGSVKYDKKDIEILKILAKDARISILEISKGLNLPPRTIAYRIKNMESKGVIAGYRMEIDLEKIGYEYYRGEFTLRDTSRTREIIQYCQFHPNILFITQAVGGADFEFQFEVKNHEEFKKINKQLIERFPEIRSIDYFTLGGYEKLKYF